MILMIDNYDSFTFNLVQYLEELGEQVVVRTNDSLSAQCVIELAPQAIVISPGPSSPREAGFSATAVQLFHKRLPILGVCLGHQTIAYALGAQVVVNDRMMHGKVSPIFHDGKTIYQGVVNPFIATRYHSLVVTENSLPSCLEVSARSDCGEIMGIRHQSYPVEGVQFHPESIMTEQGKLLIANFLSLIPRR